MTMLLTRQMEIAQRYLEREPTVSSSNTSTSCMMYNIICGNEIV